MAKTSPAPVVVRMVAPPPPAPMVRKSGSSPALNRAKVEVDRLKGALSKARANASGKAEMGELVVATLAGLLIPLGLEYFGITDIMGFDPALVVGGLLALAAFFGVAKGRMATWLLAAGFGAGIPALYNLIASFIEG